jgi:D-alanine-D-alanine ligase
MGGPSAEHEVSLATGREVYRHIDRSRYTPRAVVISRSREFFICSDPHAQLTMEDCMDPARAAAFDGPFAPHNSEAVWRDADIAFMALHGECGEDGRMQGYLDMLGIPYTGSGVYASAVSMNKIATKQLFAQHDLATPPYSLFPESSIDEIAARHGFPCFVKCPQSGSSRLMGRAADRAQLQELLERFSAEADAILVEAMVEGPEYSCPVLEYPAGAVRPLAPVLIKPLRSSFFDYEAKYTAGACEEIVPAPCDRALAERIQQTALRAHKILQCRGLSRTDMILRNDTLYALEINTLPGLTSESLAPKSFSAHNGGYADLIDILLQTAFHQQP